MNIKTAQHDDFQALAPWLVEMGQEPQRQCLHTWSGESADELCAALLDYFDDNELCYVYAWQDGQITGAMGAEYDEELGRAWLHGPHALNDEWEFIAGKLYLKLLAELPPVIKQLDAYLNLENKRAQNFYIGHGFSAHDSLNYDFWLLPEDRICAGETDCTMLTGEQGASFIELYNQTFPNAYYSGERIIQMIGDSHQVMVIAEGNNVLGFVITSALGEGSPGEIQFLSVREGYRHKRYGRRLLLAGIDWLFNEMKAPRIFLNVSEDLIYARALYESVGFKLSYTGVGLRKVL